MKMEFKFFRGYINHIVGIRGRQYLDTGYVYAPIVPVNSISVSFTPRESISRIYENVTVNPKFYGKININESE